MPQVRSQPIVGATTDTEKTVGVNGYRSVTFDIDGTASSANVKFYIISGSGNRRAVQPTRMSNGMDIVDTAGVGNIYSFDVTGITSVVVSVSGITGGNVNIWMIGVD